MNRRKMLLWGGGVAGLAGLAFGAHKSGLLPASYESDLSYAPRGDFGAGDKHFFYHSEIPEYQVVRYMMGMDANSGSWGDYAQFIRRTQKPFDEILSKVIPDFESFSRLWVENWFDIAEKRLAEGDKWFAEGKMRSARGSFLRATQYFRAGEMYSWPGTENHRLANEKASAAFLAAGRTYETPWEAVEIPYEGSSLPGIFLKSGDGPRPTVVGLSGYDGSPEEMYFLSGVEALQRGYNLLTFAGPGHRPALHRNPELIFRHDYEAPVSAVVDYALSRPDVREDKLFLVALSFGGHLATRALAHEHRFAGAAIYPPYTNIYEFFESIGAFQFLNPHMKWIHNVDTMDAFKAELKKFNTVGMEGEVRTPVYAMASVGDGEITLSQAKTFTDRIGGAVRYREFTFEENAAAHCSLNNNHLRDSITYDWMDSLV